jgi:hypothetical protein
MSTTNSSPDLDSARESLIFARLQAWDKAITSGLARQNSNSPIAEGVLLPDLSAYLLGEGFATWEKVLGEQCVHMAPDRAQRDVEGL